MFYGIFTVERDNSIDIYHEHTYMHNVDGDKIILYNTTMFTFIIPLIQIPVKCAEIIALDFI